MSITLFIFRRDLRIYDNLALEHAINLGKPILPVFILDQNILSAKKSHVNQFLIESIDDLVAQFKIWSVDLVIKYGDPSDILNELISQFEVSHIVVSRDYTPYDKKRNSKIRELSRSNRISFHEIENILLHVPDEILTKSNTPYKVFTHFYNSVRFIKTPLPKVIKLDSKQFIANRELTSIFNWDLTPFHYIENHQEIEGGRLKGISILDAIEEFKNYKINRDFPINPTTRLSAYIKFGCLSPREVFHTLKSKLGSNHELIRQLYWRDFYIYIGYHFPRVFEESFNSKTQNIPWIEDSEAFERWKQGKTGFPIVDAGMRELNQTGFMHNRVRMIVASFLTKDLFLPWWWGEKYFAEKLVDHDVSVNNGSWQWAASTGTDAVPYFRIFNPWRQQERFDPYCEYIKKWVPELRGLMPKEIHNWNQVTTSLIDYPSPIVDHKKSSKFVKEIFKEEMAISTI